MSPQPCPAGIDLGYAHCGCSQQDPHGTPQRHGLNQPSDGEMGSTVLETLPSPPLLREEWGQIQGTDLQSLHRTSCQVWEKTGIQMVILIFHLANGSPHLLTGALCLLAPQSFAPKLDGSIVREERPIRARQNLQENKPTVEPGTETAPRGAAASLGAVLSVDG